MKSNKPNCGVLYQVLKSYQPQSEAPNSVPEHITDADAWMISERGKLYKTINSETGDIYLTTNPITWKWVVRNGQSVRIKPPSKLIMTYADALKAAASSSATDEPRERVF